MVRQYNKLITLMIILLAIPYPVWFGVNFYAAGLVDQTDLIEFGMEDAFLYCQEWRPELLNYDKLIVGYTMKAIYYRDRPKRLLNEYSDYTYEESGKIQKLEPVPIQCWTHYYQYNNIKNRIKPIGHEYYHCPRILGSNFYIVPETQKNYLNKSQN